MLLSLIWICTFVLPINVPGKNCPTLCHLMCLSFSFFYECWDCSIVANCCRWKYRCNSQHRTPTLSPDDLLRATKEKNKPIFTLPQRRCLLLRFCRAHNFSMVHSARENQRMMRSGEQENGSRGFVRKQLFRTQFDCCSLLLRSN